MPEEYLKELGFIKECVVSSIPFIEKEPIQKKG